MILNPKNPVSSDTSKTLNTSQDVHTSHNNSNQPSAMEIPILIGSKNQNTIVIEQPTDALDSSMDSGPIEFK